jgi:hypothetical protein
MKHVNKYQTTQTKGKTLTKKKKRTENKHTQKKITGVNQSITPGRHIQQNNYMRKANCNII